MRKTKFYFWAAVLLPLIFLAFIRIGYLHKGESCSDAYYHMALAETGPAFFTGKSFPHMTMSTWENNYSDKELLYHFILSGICSITNIAGFENTPPFHFPALFFTSVLLLAFTYVALKFQIRHILLYSMMLVCAAPAFTYRILMMRPHLIGITLLLMVAYFSSRAKTVRDTMPLFVLGFVASWSYSNPHFIIFPIVIFAAFIFIHNKKLAFAMVFAAILGVLAGLVIHPQFPNTLITWKIQCIDVIMEVLSKHKTVLLPEELKAPGLLWAKENICFIILVLFNISGFAVLVYKNGLSRLSVPLKAVFVISVIAALGTVKSMRAIEYACPFSVLAAGLIINALRKSSCTCSRAHFSKISSGLLLIFILIGSNYVYHIHAAFLGKNATLPLDNFAKWIGKTGMIDGTVIANVCWSDFPVLYYSLPQFRYLVGLDPMFAYRRDPEKFKKIEAFRTGEIMLTPKQFAKLTGYNFIYVSAKAWQLAKAMYEHGYKIIYQGDDGYFFVIDELPEK